MMKTYLSLFLIIAFFETGYGQVGKRVAKPDNGANQSKTTGYEKPKSDLDTLKLNKTLLMTKVAAVNNYPDPAGVIESSGLLKLSPSQLTKLNDIKSAMEFKAKEMEGFIDQQEKKLNNLFASGKAEEGAIIYYTNKLGLYDGELRNAYLQAYLKTRYVLTPAQLKKYAQLDVDTKKTRN